MRDRIQRRSHAHFETSSEDSRGNASFQMSWSINETPRSFMKYATSA